MPLFYYKAAKPSGEVQEGEMEAPSYEAVIERLQDQGFLPIRAEEAGSRSVGRKALFAFRRGVRISQKDLLIFTRELATLLRAGLPLDRALTVLGDLAEHPAMENLIARIQEAVRGGASLSAALEAQGVFSRFYLNMVRAGEAGGALEDVMERLADYLERSKALKDAVLSALIYPTILLSVAGLSVVILLTFVVPQFTQLFEDMGKALPLPTRIVVAIGDGFRHYWWALALGVLGITYLFRRELQKPAFRMRFDRLKLSLPLFGQLILRLEVARFSRTLGTLLQNGVPLLTALSIVKETLENRVLAEGLDIVVREVKEGKGLAASLEGTGLFPKLAAHMIQVGEETGRLEAMLEEVARVYDEEVQTAIKRLLALLEPALILGLGIIIAGIIMSILIAILSVNELAF